MNDTTLKGLATGVGAGSATITATFTDSTFVWPVAEQICKESFVTMSAGATCDVVCPVPTQFAQSAVGTSSNGLLSFQYKWGSSTGTLGDLSKCGCQVGEEVDYPGGDPFFWPIPPWSASSPNPTINITQSATQLPLTDVHRPGVMVAPYAAASFTATQYYKYTCTGVNSGNSVTLLGPISIARSVSQNTDGTFTYTITKSGQSASCVVGSTCTQ